MYTYIQDIYMYKIYIYKIYIYVYKISYIYIHIYIRYIFFFSRLQLSTPNLDFEFWNSKLNLASFD